jgi:N-acetylglucosaminyl-diphospho-decaprenol L-rhamnosyltransferase
VAPLFSIIIVSYNSGDLLQKSVDSLISQTRRDFEVLIVDNNSTDGSQDGLDVSGLPRAEVILLEENTGFAMANNLAARRARGKWLVLLNPDAFARPDWLEQFHQAALTHPEFTQFASLQTDALAPAMMDGTGDCYLGFGIPWRGGFGHPLRTDLPIAESFSACGAGAMILRESFLKVDGFDERFFCYCEDVDLGFRLRLLGERCLFVPSAQIAHVGSASSGRNSPFTVYHGTRNRLSTYLKNMPALLLILTLPAHVVLSVYLLGRSVMRGTAGPVLRGMRDGLKAGIKMRRSPEWRVLRRTASIRDLARVMAWNPFAMSNHQSFLIPVRETVSLYERYVSPDTRESAG